MKSNYRHKDTNLLLVTDPAASHIQQHNYSLRPPYTQQEVHMSLDNIRNDLNTEINETTEGKKYR